MGEQRRGEGRERAAVDDPVLQGVQRDDAGAAAGVDGEPVERAPDGRPDEAGLRAPPAPGPLVGVGGRVVDDDDAPVVPAARREVGGQGEPGGAATDDDRVEDVVAHVIIRRPAVRIRPGTQVTGRTRLRRAVRLPGQAAWCGCRTTLV